MAGLDSIQKFEDGGTVVVKETAKGTPQIAGNIPLDPTQTAELLANMQRVLDERTGAMSTFLSGLKDATAWTAGGAQGPSSALAERDRQRLTEQQDLQKIRGEMAMLKGAQAQEDLAKQRWTQGAGTAGAGVTTGGAGSTGGLPATSGGIPISAEQLAIEASLPRYVDKEESRRKYLASRSTEATKKEFAPGMADVVEIYVPGEGFKQMTKAQAERLLTSNPNLQAIVDGQKVPAATVLKPTTPAAGEVRNNNPGNIKFGDFAKSMGATGADDRGFAIFPDLATGDAAQHKLLSGDKYSNLPLKGIADVWAPKGDGVNNPAAYTKAMQDMTGFSDATMNKKYSELTPEQQAVWRSAQKRFEHGPTSPSAPTGTATQQVVTTGGRKLTQDEYKQQQELQKELQKENIESGKEPHKQFLDNTNVQTISARETNNTRWEEWIKKYGPRSDKIVGLMNDPTLVNAVANVLTSGIQTTQGNVGIPGLEEAFQKMQKGVKKEDVEALQEIKQILESRILDVIKKSKGSSSDKDMDAFRTIAGSSKSGIDLINKLQKYDKLSIETDKADRALYDRVRKENKGALDFTDYNSNPERQGIYKSHSEKAREIAKSQFVPKKVPVRPDNVPNGAQYSPSTNSWWLNGKKVG